MLNEAVAKYREFSGDTNPNTPISRIGGYLDGYEKALEQKLKTGYWILSDEQSKEDVDNDNYRFICSERQCSDIHAKGTIVPYCWKCGARMIGPQESAGQRMSKSVIAIDTPETCGDCPFCIYTAEEKRYIGYCNTSDEDYYCKALNRFMVYDEVDSGIGILGKPDDCPLVEIF